MKRLVIGSRGSPLALVQSRIVIDLLRAAMPKSQFDLKIISTTGDEIQGRENEPLPPGKGIFTKEIEDALLAKDIDIAVHSLKDLPVDLHPALVLAAITERADPRDVLVSRGSQSLAALPQNARVATGSPRRSAQIKWKRPDVVTLDLRGNVDTRLRKLREHADWNGIILAAAGLDRLDANCSDLFVVPIPFEEMLPAPGQGALAVQVRAEDPDARNVVAAIDHAPTRAQITAERAFLAALGGGCLMPIAACAVIDGDRLKLDGICWLGKSPEPKRGSINGNVIDAEKLGRDLAAQLSA